MKKRIISLFFVLNLLILLPLLSKAGSPTWTRSLGDGTKFTLAASFNDNYIIGTLFDLDLELTADAFGTTGVVIEAFYNILVEITLDGDTYTIAANTTLADINVVGGSSSATLSVNLTGIADPEFYINSKWTFYGNNTQGNDPEYQNIWGIGRVRVKEASTAIIAPIFAVLSIAFIVQRKRRKS